MSETRRELADLSDDEKKELDGIGAAMSIVLKRLPAIYRLRRDVREQLDKLATTLLALRAEYQAAHDAGAVNETLPLEPVDDPVIIIDQMRTLLHEITYEDGEIKTEEFKPTKGRPRNVLVDWFIQVTRRYQMSRPATREFMLKLGFSKEEVSDRMIGHHARRARKEGKSVPEIRRGRPSNRTESRLPFVSFSPVGLRRTEEAWVTTLMRTSCSGRPSGRPKTLPSSSSYGSRRSERSA